MKVRWLGAILPVAIVVACGGDDSNFADDGGNDASSSELTIGIMMRSGRSLAARASAWTWSRKTSG
jgi:hypothetical protein